MGDRRQDRLLDEALGQLSRGATHLAQARFSDAVVPLHSAAAGAAAAVEQASVVDDLAPARLAQGQALAQLAYALGRCWRLRPALKAADGAVAVFVLLGGIDADETARLWLARSLNTRGEILTRLERLPESQEAHDRALALLDHALATARNRSLDSEAARARVGRGNSLADRGNAHAAVAEYRLVIDDFDADRLHDPQLVARAATALANAQVELGEAAAARESFNRAVELLESAATFDPAYWRPLLGHALSCYARACLLDGELDRAVQLGSAAVEIYTACCEGMAAPAPHADVTETGGHFAIDLVKALSVVGRAHTLAGRLAEAQVIHEQAVERLRRVPPLIEFPPAVQAFCQVDLGNALADQGRHRESVQQYLAAIEVYRSLVKQGRLQHRAGLARARTNLGNSLVAMGRARQAIQPLMDAERDYDHLVARAEGKPLRLLTDRVHARNCLARACLRAGQIAMARTTCERAIAESAAILRTARLPKLLALRARAETLMGQLFCVATSRLDLAVWHGEQARRQWGELLSTGGATHLLADCCESSIALGNALSDRREFSRSVSLHLDACSMYQELVVHRKLLQYVPEWARAEVNLGNTYRRGDAIRPALRYLVRAVKRLRRAMASQPHLEGRLAHALRCVGDALARTRWLHAADRVYGLAIAAFESISDSDPAVFRAGLAIALSHRGRLRMCEGDHAAAEADLSAAVAVFGQLQSAAAHHAESTECRINLALLARDDIAALRRTLAAITADCHDVAAAQGSALLDPGVRAFRERLLLEWEPSEGHGAPMRARFTPSEATRAVLDELERFAARHFDRDHGQLKALESLSELLQRVRPPALQWDGNVAGSRWPDYDRLLQLCLHWSADLSMNADPVWLCEPSTARRVETVVERLQALCEHRDALVADWFIHCIAPGSKDLQRTQVIDWFQGHAPSPDDPTRVALADAGEPRRAVPQRRTGVPASLSLERVQARLKDLREARGGLREALVMLTLGPGAATPVSLWIIVVQAPSGSIPRLSVQFQPIGRAFGPPAGIGDNDPSVAIAWECDFEQLKSSAAPMLNRRLHELREQEGVTRFSLIPSPPLCWMPWHLLLATSAQQALPIDGQPRVYPTIGAWWHACGETPHA